MADILDQVKKDLASSVEKASAYLMEKQREVSSVESAYRDSLLKVSALEKVVANKASEFDSLQEKVKAMKEELATLESEYARKQSQYKAEMAELEVYRQQARKAAETEYNRSKEQFDVQLEEATKRLALKKKELADFQAQWAK